MSPIFSGCVRLLLVLTFLVPSSLTVEAGIIQPERMAVTFQREALACPAASTGRAFPMARETKLHLVRAISLRGTAEWDVWKEGVRPNILPAFLATLGTALGLALSYHSGVATLVGILASVPILHSAAVKFQKLHINTPQEVWDNYEMTSARYQTYLYRRGLIFGFLTSAFLSGSLAILAPLGEAFPSPISGTVFELAMLGACWVIGFGITAFLHELHNRGYSAQIEWLKPWIPAPASTKHWKYKDTKIDRFAFGNINKLLGIWEASEDGASDLTSSILIFLEY